MPVNFVQDGDYLDYTPGAAIDAGDVVVVGDIVGVAKVAIPANTLGAIAVTGVYDVPKQASAGVAFNAGDLVYWNQADERAETTDGSSTRKLMGHATVAAVNAAATVRVRLVPSTAGTTTTTTTTTTTPAP
jgi:predicted RecA/RadA family phage recombinase